MFRFDHTVFLKTDMFYKKAWQGKRKCRLSTKTPDYQLDCVVLAASRLLDTLKRNLHFM